MNLFLRNNPPVTGIVARQLLLAAALLSLVRTATLAQDLFNGNDLAGWRKPTGDWMPAKAVSLDPTNAEKFTISSGEGILVNGAKGKSVNLISTSEFADL